MYELLQAARDTAGVEPALMVQLVLATLNVGLLVAIVLVFVQNYRKLPTHFGLGLIVFALALLLQTGMGILQLVSRTRGGFLLFVTLPEVFMFAALLVLLYLVTK